MNQDSKTGAFALIEIILLLFLLAWEGNLIIGNHLGLTWWAKVEANNSNATYWFGPFLTKNALVAELDQFISDLYREGSSPLNHSFHKGYCDEPLTIVASDQFPENFQRNQTYTNSKQENAGYSLAPVSTENARVSLMKNQIRT